MPDPQLVWTDEDGVVHIRNSERGTLNKCPQRWWWNWREGLQPKETAKALWFGTGIHLALAHYYGPGKKRRKDFIDLWETYAVDEAAYVRTVGALDETVWVEAKDLGITMLQGYRDHYQGDKNWHVVGTEQEFSVRIPFNEESVARQHWGDYFILNGTFDGVYYDLDDKKFKLMEHKTAGTVSIGHLPMDNQAGTYWATAQTVGLNAGWLKKGQNISTITYNFLRKGLPDDRPKDAQGYSLNKPTKQAYIDALDDHVVWDEGPRGGIKYPTIERMEELAKELGIVVLGERSKNQPAPLFVRHPVKRKPRERVTQIQRLKDEVDRMALYVLGDLAVTKSPSRDTCPMCPFKEMCELHEGGVDWVDFRDSLFVRRDPYADHRKDAGAA